MGKDNIGRDVLTFLAGNLLDPTPMNYRFGYLYLTRSSKVICEETDTYIENGMRMKQETIVEIMGKHASASDDPEERIAARDEALDAYQEKSRFFAMMSHEMRTPLNGIIGMTEFALASDLTAEQRAYLLPVAGHIVSADPNLPRSGREQGADDPHERALARPVWTKQAEEARAKGQLDTVERRVAPLVGVAKARDLDRPGGVRNGFLCNARHELRSVLVGNGPGRRPRRSLALNFFLYAPMLRFVPSCRWPTGNRERETLEDRHGDGEAREL